MPSTAIRICASTTSSPCCAYESLPGRGCGRSNLGATATVPATLAAAPPASTSRKLLFRPLPRNLRRSTAALVLFREQLHGPLEAVQGGGEHAAVHQLLHDADRLAVVPDLLGLGVEPDALRVYV